MKEIRSALVVGAGAVGAAIASVIFSYNQNAVALCAGAARKEKLEKEGLVINAAQIRFHIAAPGLDGPYDLVIVAVKNHHLESAIADMRSFVGQETKIISLLNGITSEASLAKAFGEEKIVPALIIGIDALRDKNKITFPHPGEIRFGDARNIAGAWSDTVSRIADFFSRAKLPFSVPEDMTRALWYKFMFNVGTNQWSAILSAPYNVFKDIEYSQILLRKTMQEVVALSAAAGTGLKEEDIDTIIAVLKATGDEGKSSMLQDVEARRKTEVESFAGEIMRLGKLYGVPTPINEALFYALKTMETRYL